jgi:hypothetical protein
MRDDAGRPRALSTINKSFPASMITKYSRPPPHDATTSTFYGRAVGDYARLPP